MPSKASGEAAVSSNHAQTNQTAHEHSTLNPGENGMDDQELATIFALGFLARNPKASYAEVAERADRLAALAGLDALRFRSMVICAALQNSGAIAGLHSFPCSRSDS